MRRLTLFLFFTVLLGWTLSNLAGAATSSAEFAGMSSTVQVIAFEHTRNDELIPTVSGSGTLIRADGLIITNNHVVESAEDVKETYDIFAVCFSFNFQEKPRCEYTASLLARDRAMDVALLKVDSQDIRGNLLPALPFLSYETSVDLKEGDEITFLGFPGIGLETITLTKGQVSGFEEINAFRYVKTDTTIAPGNSGGTALGPQGAFVGIPTYGVSTFGSSLGYFLDLKEALPWIGTHKDDVSRQDDRLRTKLGDRLKVENDARKTKVYHHPLAPAFTWRIPRDWDFDGIEINGLGLFSLDESKNYRIDLSLQHSPFPFTPEYLEASVFEKIEKNKDNYSRYERRPIVFHNAPGYTISYLAGDTKVVHYLIPYGKTLFFFHLSYNFADEEAALKEYAEVLDGFEFSAAPDTKTVPQEIRRKTPPFSVRSVPGWYLLENREPQNDELLVELLRPDNIEGEISIRFIKLTESEGKLSAAQLLKQVLEDHETLRGFRLLNSSAEVMVDGLPGISLTYTYEGEDFGTLRKATKMYLPAGDHAYYFEYDDLGENYDRYLRDFQAFLRSFQNLDPELGTEKKGVYLLGTMNSVFSDVSYHRYEQAIAKLQERGIVGGYPDGTFRPEKHLSRAEILKIIFEAKMNLEERQNKKTLRENVAAYAGPEFSSLDFPDTEVSGSFRPYLRYAREKKLATGYADGLFHPDDPVTLAEASKMLLRVFEIPVWESEAFSGSFPWHKAYLDKSFELGIIPYGLYDPDHVLTRGEMAALVAALMSQAEKTLPF